MRTAAAKTEETRLDRSVLTDANQLKSRGKPAAETKKYAQFGRRVPDPRYNPHKRLDPGTKPPQHAGEGILLGECRVSCSYAPPV